MWVFFDYISQWSLVTFLCSPICWIFFTMWPLAVKGLVFLKLCLSLINCICIHSKACPKNKIIANTIKPYVQVATPTPPHPTPLSVPPPPSCHKPSYLTYKPILLTQKAFWFSETSPLSQIEIKLTNLRGYLKYRMCKNMQEKLFHDVIATPIQIKDWLCTAM